MGAVEAEAGGGVIVPVAGAKLALEAGVAGISLPIGTRSALTGLGRIAALPGVGVPNGREVPPHAPMLATRPQARHAAKATPPLQRGVRARDELSIGDRVAEPQAFV